MRPRREGLAGMPMLDHALTLFRATMPGVAGVVLASARGDALAHDLDAPTRASELAASATRLHVGGQSVLVPDGSGMVLVVFLDESQTLIPPTVAAPA